METERFQVWEMGAGAPPNLVRRDHCFLLEHFRRSSCCLHHLTTLSQALWLSPTPEEPLDAGHCP